MKRNKGIHLSILCLLLTMMLASLASCAQKATADTPQTFTGIVTDEHCFLKKPDPTLDSKKCLLMPACAATGYGLAVLQGDKTYAFYFLDGAFAPAATGAQEEVGRLIEASSKADHFYFAVTGTLTGEKKSVDGRSYPVLQVSEIRESDG